MTARVLGVLVCALVVATGCAAGGPSAPGPPAVVSSPTPSAGASSTPTLSPSATSPSPTSSPARPANAPVQVRYRAENRAHDADSATGDFLSTLAAVLGDARGWSRAGFRFVADPQGPYRIVLAEGSEVDALCLPLDTASTYSCQNGPVVALNADRWRGATPEWTGDLASYRVMLINHEVGHLLHLHHPRPQCPGPGLPAPVMAQQSTELGDCLPNPWPLDWEIELAARRAEPLAPPAEHDPSDHRPTPPRATS